MTNQAQKQQLTLAEQFRRLSAQVAKQPSFDNCVVLHVSTCNNYEPTNPFLGRHDSGHHTNLITSCPFCDSGYLIEMRIDQLNNYADHIESSNPEEKEEISHIKSVCFFKTQNSSSTKLDKIWETTKEFSGCKIINIELMPLHSHSAAENLIKKFNELRNDIFRSTELLDRISPSPNFAAGIEFTLKRYLNCPSYKREFITAPVWSRKSLDKLVASGTVLRIETNNETYTTD